MSTPKQIALTTEFFNHYDADKMHCIFLCTFDKDGVKIDETIGVRIKNLVKKLKQSLEQNPKYEIAVMQLQFNLRDDQKQEAIDVINSLLEDKELLTYNDEFIKKSIYLASIEGLPENEYFNKYPIFNNIMQFNLALAISITAGSTAKKIMEGLQEMLE